MPDTFTPNLNLDLPPISAYDLFGAKINANFTAIDTAALMLAGTPLSPTAPTTGQALVFNGTSWAPGSGGGGAATSLATTGSPVVVSAAAPPAPGQALIATSATTATWQAVVAQSVLMPNGESVSSDATPVITAASFPAPPFPASGAAMYGATLLSPNPKGYFAGGFLAPDVDADGYSYPAVMAPSMGQNNPSALGLSGGAWISGAPVFGTNFTQSGGNAFISAGSPDFSGGGMNIAAGISGGTSGGGMTFFSGNVLGWESDSGDSPATSVSAGATLTMSIDGEAAQTIVLAANSTGIAIAADIQAKVQALTAATPTNQISYSGFQCQFSGGAYQMVAPGDVLTHMQASLVVSTGLSSPDVAAALQLGIDNGGQEYFGGVGGTGGFHFIAGSGSPGTSTIGYWDGDGLNIFGGSNSGQNPNARVFLHAANRSGMWVLEHSDSDGSFGLYKAGSGSGFGVPPALFVNSSEQVGINTSSPAHPLDVNGSINVGGSLLFGGSSALGGDLSGTLPNPTVAGIRNTPVTEATPTDGQVLTYSATDSQWEPTNLPAPITEATPTGYAGGDLSGEYPNPSVTSVHAIQGETFSSDTNNSMPIFNWSPVGPAFLPTIFGPGYGAAISGVNLKSSNPLNSPGAILVPSINASGYLSPVEIMGPSGAVAPGSAGDGIILIGGRAYGTSGSLGGGAIYALAGDSDYNGGSVNILSGSAGATGGGLSLWTGSIFGWQSVGGSGAATSVAANSTLTMTINGESPLTINLGSSAITGGANIAAAIQSAVRASTPASVDSVSSVVIQDLTYTSISTGLAGRAIAISYQTGGTAGSEVVTVSSAAIHVQIASGVSTAAQVMVAVLSYPAAAILVGVAVSGDPSHAQTAPVPSTHPTGGAYSHSYASFTASFTNTIYTLTTPGDAFNKYNASLVVTTGLSGLDVAASLKLGVANGGVETIPGTGGCGVFTVQLGHYGHSVGLVFQVDAVNGASISSSGNATYGQILDGSLTLTPYTLATTRWQVVARNTGGAFELKSLTGSNGFNGAAVFHLDHAAPASSIFVNSTGQVGINTSSPAHPLDVNGSINVGGSLLFGGSSALGGDLSGTLPNPTVAGIRNTPVTEATPTDGQVLTYSATDSQWEPTVPKGIVVIDSAPGTGATATETMSLAGLLTSDTIMTVAYKVPGAVPTIIVGFANQISDFLDVTWTSAQGAGAVVRVSVWR